MRARCLFRPSVRTMITAPYSPRSAARFRPHGWGSRMCGCSRIYRTWICPHGRRPRPSPRRHRHRSRLLSRLPNRRRNRRRARSCRPPSPRARHSSTRRRSIPAMPSRRTSATRSASCRLRTALRSRATPRPASATGCTRWKTRSNFTTAQTSRPIPARRSVPLLTARCSPPGRARGTATMSSSVTRAAMQRSTVTAASCSCAPVRR